MYESVYEKHKLMWFTIGATHISIVNYSSDTYIFQVYIPTLSTYVCIHSLAYLLKSYLSLPMSVADLLSCQDYILAECTSQCFRQTYVISAMFLPHHAESASLKCACNHVDFAIYNTVSKFWLSVDGSTFRVRVS